MESRHTAYHDDEESGIPEPSLAESSDLHIRSRASTQGEEARDFPLWMRESSSWWSKLPLSIRRIVRAISRTFAFLDQWTRGPKEAQKQEINPLFPLVQEAPLWLVERFLPKRIHKLLALLLLYFAWAITFVVVIQHSATSGDIEGYGTPNSIWCGENFWRRGNDCGLGAAGCRPFADATFTFRCPADCKSLMVLEPYPVGDQEIIYSSLVIGGSNESSSSPIYRADSFICQAAIHAGIVSNTQGGCGVALLKGSQTHFPASSSNSIQSIEFNADFPKSYTFLTDLSSDCGVVDNRWFLLGITVSFTVIISLFVSSPAVFFFSTFTMIFYHVGFVSDPPNTINYPELFSVMIGKFLPACFIVFVFYRYCIRRTLLSLTAQVEKSVLWLGACWVGALDNYTFSHIPIQRLTPRDLSQPGAIPALITIIIIILLIAVGQVYYLRLEHRLRTYICLYAGMIALLLIGVALPTHNLRIHHYILAMLLLPGTAMQTRPALIYQGLLMGLFINGVARWGFAPVLETSFALFGGRAEQALKPNITALAVSGAANIDFSWAWPPEGYDGLSVLTNDVETFRWYVGEGNSTFTSHAKELPRLHDTFYRFAYMKGSSTAEYTRAGVWWKNGSWSGIPADD